MKNVNERTSYTASRGKLSRCIVLPAAVAAVFLCISCSGLLNTVAGSSSGSGTDSVPDGKCEVTVSPAYSVRSAFPSALPDSTVYLATISYTSGTTTNYLGTSEAGDFSDAGVLVNTGTSSDIRFIFATPTVTASNYTLTLYACPSGTTDTSYTSLNGYSSACYANGTSSAFSLSAGQRTYDTALFVTLVTNTSVMLASSATGSVNLTYSWSGITDVISGSVKVTNADKNSMTVNTTGNVDGTFYFSYSNSTLTASKIPAGNYTVMLTLTNSSGTIDLANPVQTITVYADSTTNTWYDTDGTAVSGALTITKADQTVFYVCGSSPKVYGTNITSVTDGDDTNNGTILAPLATISAAVTKCTDTSKKYTICIDGTITLGSTISVNDNKKITFSGINGSDTDIIDGGHTSGTDGYLIMNIDNGSTVTIENLKLQHGYNHINDKGGGLCNNGTLTVKNSIIISCLAKTLGGGIYNDSTGNLTIAGSTIKSCNHSGIYNYGGTFTMDGGTISGNAADNVGGGIDNENGTVYMSGGTITGNTANNNGGGVYNTGTFNMSGGTISGNTAKTKGGGVYNAGGTFTMSGDDTTITYNKVTASNGVGGGVYNAGTFNMSGSAVIDAETAGANDVYLSSGKYITVTGALTPESNTNLTGETKSAVITPNGYSTGTIVVVLSEGVTETTLADEVGNFSLSDTNYVIKNNGKIAVAPDNVTSFAAATGDGQIKLSWTNPSDSDFSKAVVTWTTTADTSTQVGTEDVSGTAGAAGTYTVTGLTNGTSYTFTVKAFDTSNNASSGVTVTQYPMYGLTETPVTLAAGTDGTAGTSGTYVKFGDWPQTIKAGSVTVSTNTASNGYYYGSDGYYYANVSAAPYGTYTFSDGTAVTGDSTYYFKVEPIKWRVLSGAGTSNALVAAESILTNIRYYGTINRRKLDSTTIYANNYKYSNIRAYLNGTANQYVTDGGTATSYDIDWTDKGFLQTAFTSTARAKIQTTTVDNSLEQMSYDGTDGTSSTYVCDDTNDKVFLLSEAEAVNTTYYAVYSAVGSSSKRMKKVCDYARATGAKMTTDQGYDQYCGWWWLRSPLFCGDYSARVVQNSGNAGYNEDVDSTYDGVAPALLLSFQ